MFFGTFLPFVFAWTLAQSTNPYQARAPGLPRQTPDALVSRPHVGLALYAHSLLPTSIRTR